MIYLEPSKNIISANPCIHAFLFSTNHINMIIGKVEICDSWCPTSQLAQYITL